MLFVARVAKYTKQSLASEHPNIFSVLCYSCTVYLLVVKLASYDSYPSYKNGKTNKGMQIVSYDVGVGFFFKSLLVSCGCPL